MIKHVALACKLEVWNYCLGKEITITSVLDVFAAYVSISVRKSVSFKPRKRLCSFISFVKVVIETLRIKSTCLVLH